jgi:hypothetical protein
MLGDHAGPAAGLKIEKNAGQVAQQVKPSSPDSSFYAAFEHPVKKFIQPRAVPPAVHVSLAESEIALAQHACKQSLVSDLDIPRSRTIDSHIGNGKQIFNQMSAVRHDRLPSGTGKQSASFFMQD